MTVKSTLCLIFCLLMSFSTLDAQTFTNYTTTEGLVHNNVNCLAVDENDHIWFGTQEGISSFDGNIWLSYNTANGAALVDDNILAMAFDNEGNLWLGTDFGLTKFNGITWVTYTEDDGLADNRVKYIQADLDNHIWVGNNDGVSVFDGTNWTSYTMADGLPFGGVNFVEIAANGDKYFGTGLGGVYVFDGTSFTAITEDEGLLTDKITSIAIDEQNNKWVGSTDGISVMNVDNQVVEHHTRIFTIPEPDTLNPVEDVQIDSKGNIWVGVYVDYLVTEGGVSMYDGTGWIDYDVSDGLIGPVVRRLEIDSEDNVWVATSTGVTKISDIPASVAKVYEATDFEVFPNPTTDLLTINILNTNFFKNDYLEVYNMAGQLVERVAVAKTEATINLEVRDLSAGMYVIKMGQQVARVIVK